MPYIEVPESFKEFGATSVHISLDYDAIKESKESAEDIVESINEECERVLKAYKEGNFTPYRFNDSQKA